MLIYLFFFNTKITIETFFPLFQTNLFEAFEFYISTFPFLFSCGILFFLFILWKYITCSFRPLGKKAMYSFGLLGVLLLLVLILGNVKRHILLFSIYEESKKLCSMIPHGYTVQREKSLKAFTTQEKKGAHLYVLVIGESATRQGLGAYGYYRDTTPFLSSTLGKENTLLMDSVYTSATYTEQAVFSMLTNHTGYDDEQRRVSVLDIARSAGVKTIWITNQSMLDATNPQVSAIAEQADIVISDRGGLVSYAQYDEYLLPHIEHILNTEVNEENILIVIHLYGSHINFCRRFDKNKYSIFTDIPSNIQHTKYNEVNCYDNSIYATDDVLRRIVALVEEKSTFQFLLYVSDHGEGVYRGVGRGHPESVQDVLRVPFYIYMSDVYREANEKRVEILHSHSNRGYTTDMLFDTLLGLMDIKSTAYRSQYDISSTSYAYEYDTLKHSGSVYIKDSMK